MQIKRGDVRISKWHCCIICIGESPFVIWHSLNTLGDVESRRLRFDLALSFYPSMSWTSRPHNFNEPQIKWLMWILSWWRTIHCPKKSPKSLTLYLSSLLPFLGGDVAKSKPFSLLKGVIHWPRIFCIPFFIFFNEFYKCFFMSNLMVNPSLGDTSKHLYDQLYFMEASSTAQLILNTLSYVHNLVCTPITSHWFLPIL